MEERICAAFGIDYAENADKLSELKAQLRKVVEDAERGAAGGVGVAGRGTAPAGAGSSTAAAATASLGMKRGRDGAPVPTAARAVVAHDIKAAPGSVGVTVSTMACVNCANNDEERFEWNYESGDVTCLLCGAVTMEHTLFEGEAHRNFSDSTEVRLVWAQWRVRVRVCDDGGFGVWRVYSARVRGKAQ